MALYRAVLLPTTENDSMYSKFATDIANAFWIGNFSIKLHDACSIVTFEIQ